MTDQMTYEFLTDKMIDLANLQLPIWWQNKIEPGDYFIHRETYLVYSRRRSERPILMHGTRKGNWTYYRFQGHKGEQIDLASPDIIDAVKKYLKTLEDIVADVAQRKQEEAAASKSQGWVVAQVIPDGRLSMDTTGVILDNEQLANEEAERLALAFPGQSFVKLEIKGIAEAAQVVWR